MAKKGDTKDGTKDNIEHEQRQGPLAGIVSASTLIKQSKARYCLISPCDTPYLPSDYVEKLKLNIQKKDYDVAIVHDGKRRQNLHCLIKVSALDSLTAFYQIGGRALFKWFDEVRSLDVNLSHQVNAFTNINTLAELNAQQKF